MTQSSEHPSTLAVRVRARRLTLGLSYSDLALRLKTRGIRLNRQTLSLWERGKRSCSFDAGQLALLADALEWTLQELNSD